MILDKKIYKSSNNYSIFTVLKDCFNGYKASFYLAKQLAIRDIKAQYRQSVLGVLWAVAPVLMSAFIWIFLNGTGTIKLSSTSVPYPLFVVIGSTLWTIFTDCLLLGINSVNSNKSIITKINFHKEALISSGIIKLLFSLLIKLTLVAGLMIYYQVNLSFSFTLFLPLLIVAMLAFTSLGVLITPIGVLFSDVSRIIPIFMQILMYFTPVVYNVPKEGLMKTVMEGNPLTYIIINLRNTLTGFNTENWPLIVGFSILTILISLFSMIVYRISIPIITERMSS